MINSRLTQETKRFTKLSCVGLFLSAKFLFDLKMKERVTLDEP